MPSPPDPSSRSLPEPLARLSSLALDLHWAWNHAGDAVWRQLDEVLWERTQNPWLLLQYVPFERLQRLARDQGFLRDLQVLEESRERYRATPPWRPPGATSLPRVAYFSMEFGLHEALPLYAGGLGILAGDYLKTASDLDTPVVGIGILWQQGYFRQVLDAAGRQTELYPFNEPASLPVQPVVSAGRDRLRIPIALAGRTILLRAWQVTVGRTMLYLLDSNDPFNAPADRGLTSTLYGGNTEVRLLQEIILGVGGWRLARALDLGIEICHLNEGHAALVVIERARHFMQQHDTTFREALWTTRAGNVFTTHTAVPAGFDTFAADAIERYRPYLDEYIRSLGVPWSELLALGRRNPDDAQEPFNMAWLAMRGCSWVNGVSTLHGAVSRRLFAGLFPRRPWQEVPIGHVTNGVHVPSWDSPWTDALWTRTAGKERWRGDVSALAADMLRLSDEDLWRVRARERADLVRYARERLLRKLARHRGLDAAARTAGEVLHPDALTLGFARRFAGYKRPNLLLADPARLLDLLTSARRPVQIIVAGKAHPRDEESKALIQQWAQFAARPEARAHVVFLDDYDMRLAAELVQGVDVWISTPRRPWEASGTSGMKVLVNGGLNLSTLDGWWAEAFDRDYGWALGDRVERPDDDEQEALQLYALLEQEVIPTFYERDADGFPRRWIAMMRASMARLAPRFSSVRMLQEYVERAYLPAAASYRRRAARENGVSQDLERWSRRLERYWSGIRFGEMTACGNGGRLTVSVPVLLGEVARDAVRVELYADPEDGGEAFVQQMGEVEEVSDGPNAWIYSATIDTARPPGDFTARVVPCHPEAHIPMENPLIAWQR
ncbi:MAG: alpha-glucan family phosphorylase [Betaproteobacteria bacterium]